MREVNEQHPFSILVGYDGSDAADAAIEGLAHAGLPDAGIAHVVTVAEMADVAATASFGNVVIGTGDVAPQVEAIRENATILAGDGAAKLRAILPGWHVDAEATEGSSHRSLIYHAERHDVDLIVVGSRGQSAFRRFMLGSTAQFVGTHARCSVRIARGNGGERWVSPRTPRLLVAIDGSRSADAAVDAVAHRRWPAGTKAHLLMAIEPGIAKAIHLRAVHEPARSHLETAAAVIDDAAAKLRAAGLAVSTQMQVGNPKRLILEEAEARCCDTICVGSQGHNGIDRLLFGSVSAAVMAGAHCTVEIERGPPAVDTGVADDFDAGGEACLFAADGRACDQQSAR